MCDQRHKFEARTGASSVQHQIHHVLVVAVQVELDAVLDAMSPLDREQALLKVFEGDSVYYAGKVGLYNCVAVMCHMGATGRDSSILATSTALKTWKPTAGVIMPGIAFGRFGPPTDGDRSPKQLIGDVIVATQVVPYEPQRMGISENVPRGAHPESSLLFCNRLRNLGWQWTPSGSASTRGILEGPLLSGEKLVDDPAFKAKLFEEFPKAIGGEMEGAGVYAAAARESVNWIVVKSICDWGDGNKSKEHQPLAAKNSVSVVAALLSEPGMPTGEGDRIDQVQAAVMRSKIELIRRADEVRQSKSGALMKLLASVPRDNDGNLQVPISMKPIIEILSEEHRVALEQWLNAYEDACGEFLAGGIARKYFDVGLGQEIRELVELDGPQQERLRPRESSPYKAIHATYEALLGSHVAPLG
jgi:nucleoside phosphorylase